MSIDINGGGPGGCGKGNVPRFEAVITCVDYGDYLAESLPENRGVFDHIIVVTSNEDRETLEVCRRHSVQCVQTNKFTAGGRSYNKARGVTHGLKYTRYQDWVCQLDADTVLSPSARHWLLKRPLDKSFIYGCDRVNCVGWDRWQAYKQEDHRGYDYNCRVHFPPGMPVLDRIALEHDAGWIPIGFFQLWHSSSRRVYPFADGPDATAEHCDIAHAAQWDDDKRQLLGEFYAIHLQAEACPLGANWKGRTTPRFGPPPK